MRSQQHFSNDDAEAWTRCARGSIVRVETNEVRYIDTNGDGMPDIVEHVTRRATRTRRSAVVDRVEETRRLEYGIGFDGKPEGVAERASVFALRTPWMLEHSTTPTSS